jgi:hypothetical protein
LRGDLISRGMLKEEILMLRGINIRTPPNFEKELLEKLDYYQN